MVLQLSCDQIHHQTLGLEVLPGSSFQMVIYSLTPGLEICFLAPSEASLFSLFDSCFPHRTSQLTEHPIVESLQTTFILEKC